MTPAGHPQAPIAQLAWAGATAQPVLEFEGHAIELGRLPNSDRWRSKLTWSDGRFIALPTESLQQAKRHARYALWSAANGWRPEGPGKL